MSDHATHAVRHTQPFKGGEQMELTREERLFNLICQRIVEQPDDVVIYRDAFSCVQEMGAVM